MEERGDFRAPPAPAGERAPPPSGKPTLQLCRRVGTTGAAVWEQDRRHREALAVWPCSTRYMFTCSAIVETNLRGYESIMPLSDACLVSHCEEYWQVRTRQATLTSVRLGADGLQGQPERSNQVGTSEPRGSVRLFGLWSIICTDYARRPCPIGPGQPGPRPTAAESRNSEKVAEQGCTCG